MKQRIVERLTFVRDVIQFWIDTAENFRFGWIRGVSPSARPEDGALESPPRRKSKCRKSCERFFCPTRQIFGFRKWLRRTRCWRGCRRKYSLLASDPHHLSPAENYTILSAVHGMLMKIFEIILEDLLALEDARLESTRQLFTAVRTALSTSMDSLSIAPGLVMRRMGGGTSRGNSSGGTGSGADPPDCSSSGRGGRGPATSSGGANPLSDDFFAASVDSPMSPRSDADSERSDVPQSQPAEPSRSLNRQEVAALASAARGNLEVSEDEDLPRSMPSVLSFLETMKGFIEGIIANLQEEESGSEEEREAEQDGSPSELEYLSGAEW